MKHRGRQSAAELATVSPFPVRLLAPPVDLTEAEAGVWSRVVATKDPGWFDAGSIPLLTAYCRATAQADGLADAVNAVMPHLATDEGLGRYKELRKIQATLSGEMASLATKLRLTQQSRYTPASSANRKTEGGRKPWESRVIDQT